MTARATRFGTVVLTGATSGIGRATARLLAAEAAVLVLLGPEEERSVAPVLDQIRSAGPATVHYVSADFTHFHEVVRAAREIRALVGEIDLLINDAGVPGAPERMVTSDDFERTLQVNALAPALLTRLLVPSLANGARVVNVGSAAHHLEHFAFDDVDLANEYTPVMAYARAKLAMVTWSSLLAEELESLPVEVVALCPGLNATALSAAMAGSVGGPPSVGAERVLHAALATVASGSYLENDRVVSPSSEVLEPDNRARLAELYWERLSPYTTGGEAAR